MPKNEEVSLASLGIQMPYSMQAEQSVLGAALVDETVLNRLITDMEPEMFYSDQNRAIYETMRRSTPRARPLTLSRLSTRLPATRRLPAPTTPRSIWPASPRRCPRSRTLIPILKSSRRSTRAAA